MLADVAHVPLSVADVAMSFLMRRRSHEVRHFYFEVRHLR